MSFNTKIQWCDHTWNPWIGCSKVSPGCLNCYAETVTPSRTFGIQWGKGHPRFRTSESYWKQPSRWNADASRTSDGQRRPRRVFPSLCDWLDDEVPIAWLADFLTVIFQTPDLDWLLLTKRPENFVPRLRAVQRQFTVDPLDIVDRSDAWLAGERVPHNVWFGVSAENQRYWDERVELLKKIPAAVRFISAEPLLESINCGFPAGARLPDRPDGWETWGQRKKDEFTTSIARAVYIARCSIGINWVIVGGESGPKARRCEVDWVDSMVGQCRAVSVPVFVKQLGSSCHVNVCTCGRNSDGHWKGPAPCFHCHGILKLKHPKGGDPEEWPENLWVREWPDLGKANK